MSAPKIAVVIPTRNRGRFLGDSIKSAFLQSVDVEVIVVRLPGDQDVPNVREVSDDRVMTIQAVDGVTNLASGLKIAQGRISAPWVVHSTDDDVMLPGSLSSAIEVAEDVGADCLGCRLVHIKEDTRLEHIGVPHSRGKPRVRSLRWNEVIGPFSALPMPGRAIYRTDLAAKVQWREDLPIGAPMDRYFAMEAFAQSESPFTAEISILGYRSHSQNLTKLTPMDAILRNYEQWLAWARAEFPEMRTREAQRALKAEGHFVLAESYYREARPWKVGSEALWTAAWFRQSIQHSAWWRMLGYSIVRGMDLSLRSSIAKVKSHGR
ncbi:MAG: glycosyltransferase [Sulfobacillus sp.]